MWKDLLWVGAGSCLGGMARYLMGVLCRSLGGVLPWGTAGANMLGCLLIGVLWALLDRWHASPVWSLFLMVGFCGGFTTFSSFSKESLALLQAGHVLLFAVYAVGSVVLGLAAVALGFWLAK